MKLIPLKNGSSAMVDDADYLSLSKYNWIEVRGYAVRNSLRSERPCTRHIRMHRQIMKCTAGEVDHINGNKLDNRRENLRLCSRAENCRNRTIQKNNKSGFKGVHAVKGKGWRAIIMLENRNRHIGYYETAELAARAYDFEAVKLFGKFARVNFV